MNAVTTTTGGGLSFSVAGAGVSVDPATGIFRILTDALRDGVEISITASNAGGAATTRFRLSVVPEPEAPELAAPVLITPPALAGTGRIGDEVELDTGVWGGTPAPEVSVEWRRDGIAISGAGGLAYVPGPEDDLADLTAHVTATNAAGSAVAEAAPLDIVWPAPAVIAELFDLVLVQGPGGATAEAGAVFTGGALVFTVTGAGASIDPATGRLSIPTDQPVAAAEITVTASNSGGSAAAGFRVTVEPVLAAPVLVVPPSLAGDGTIDSEIVLDPGTWAGVPDPEVAVQWLRDGAAIGGATAPPTCRVRQTTARCCAAGSPPAMPPAAPRPRPRRSRSPGPPRSRAPWPISTSPWAAVRGRWRQPRHSPARAWPIRSPAPARASMPRPAASLSRPTRPSPARR